MKLLTPHLKSMFLQALWLHNAPPEKRKEFYSHHPNRKRHNLKRKIWLKNKTRRLMQKLSRRANRRAH